MTPLWLALGRPLTISILHLCFLVTNRRRSQSSSNQHCCDSCNSSSFNRLPGSLCLVCSALFQNLWCVRCGCFYTIIISKSEIWMKKRLYCSLLCQKFGFVLLHKPKSQCLSRLTCRLVLFGWSFGRAYRSREKQPHHSRKRSSLLRGERDGLSGKGICNPSSWAIRAACSIVR